MSNPLPLVNSNVATGTGVVPGAHAATHKLTGSDPLSGIKESQLSLNFPTHSNANDPSSGQKAALAGTNGTPSGANRYVTDSDPRLSGAATYSAQTEVDFGATLYQHYKVFTVTDANITSGMKILAALSQDAGTGRDADESLVESFVFSCKAGTGSFTMLMRNLVGSVVGKFKVDYIAA